MKKAAFDPKNPPPITRAETQQLEALDAVADEDIDTSDIPELTDDAFRRGYASMLARRAREATGLSQPQFATRYQIPLGSLKDWEQGRRTPEKAAQNFLRLVAADPEGVAQTLDRGAA